MNSVDDDINYIVIKDLETDAQNKTTSEHTFITIPANTLLTPSGKGQGKIVYFECSFDGNEYEDIILQNHLITDEFIKAAPSGGRRRRHTKKRRTNKKKQNRKKAKKTKRRYRLNKL